MVDTAKLRGVIAERGMTRRQVASKLKMSEKTFYSHLKRRHSKFSGEIFSFEEFVKKSESPCHYCGLEWSKEIQDRRNETIKDGLFSDVVVKCNGIDRIDSEVGYTSKNTVPCCKYCNTAKNTMTQREFKRWIVRVYENFATR